MFIRRVSFWLYEVFQKLWVSGWKALSVTIQNRDNKQAVLSRGVVSGLYKIDIRVFSNVLCLEENLKSHQLKWELRSRISCGLLCCKRCRVIAVGDCTRKTSESDEMKAIEKFDCCRCNQSHPRYGSYWVAVFTCGMLIVNAGFSCWRL